MTLDLPERLPNDPILARLLLAASKIPAAHIVVHDAYGFEKTYLHLLADILALRKLLLSRLSTLDALLGDQGIVKDESRYVGLVSTSGYECLVAFFAIRAVGGAPILLNSGMLPEEAHYLLSKANARCVVGSTRCVAAGEAISAYMISHGYPGFFSIQTVSQSDPLKSLDAVQCGDDINLLEDGPGAVLFTSGTTGKPKMVVLPRRCFLYTEFSESGSATVSYRPIHWIGGIRWLLQAILTGVTLYALEEKASSSAILEVFGKHRINSMSFSPLTLRTMKEVLTTRMQKEPDVDYASWFEHLPAIKCGGSMIEASTMEFWSQVTGRPVEIFYSATELGGPSIQGVSSLPNSIGRPVGDVKVKLSEGDHGEILVKSPILFTHYLGDEKATREAFDYEGYYKTGDLAERKDGEYVFGGRANSDFILFAFNKIPTLLVENTLLDLPYISEACVLGIPHPLAKELCAAVVRIRAEDEASFPSSPDLATFSRIREDLARTLPPYMMPRLLRVLKDGEALPVTSIGKPIKSAVRREFFLTTAWWSAENKPKDVQAWPVNGATKTHAERTPRAWDWCGNQSGS